LIFSSIWAEAGSMVQLQFSHLILAALNVTFQLVKWKACTTH
jgi:hypothetical protein